MASNSDVAHAWAHGLDKCHYGSNMHHDGGYLYSYSTCIGQRIEYNGRIIFLTNNYHYSNSSCKHQGCMFGAIPNEDNNVVCFNIERNNYGCDRLIYMGYDYKNNPDNETVRENIIQFGFKWIVDDYMDCKDVSKCNTLKHKFNRRGFKQFLLWLVATECISVNKLLKMNSEKLLSLLPYNYGKIDNIPAKKFKSFFKLLIENAPDEQLVDIVNGKGEYQKYLERTKGLRLAQRMREITDICHFLNANTRYRKFHCVHGDFTPAKMGSITSKDCIKWQKEGVLIQQLYNIRKANIEYAIKVSDKENLTSRRESARGRLERHCGMCGWGGPYWVPRKNKVNSFNYCGTTIVFSECRAYSERKISSEEYAAFRVLSKDEQKTWIENKKRWMLEQLQNDRIAHENWQARYEEEQRVRMELEAKQNALEAERAAYKSSLLAQGESGLRQAWHEGFRVSVWNQSLSFYFGGNVLLRVINDDYVETSKGIKVSKEECKRLWAIINRWHENNTEFDGVETVNAIGNRWQISRYKNDILTAGCHSIAYCEMKRIAEQLGFAA